MGTGVGCPPQASRPVPFLQAGHVAFSHLSPPTTKTGLGPKQEVVSILWMKMQVDGELVLLCGRGIIMALGAGGWAVGSHTYWSPTTHTQPSTAL